MAFDGFLHLLFAHHEDDVEHQNEVRIYQRQLRDASNPFTLHDALFLKLFRLNKFSCQNLIEVLSPLMVQSQRATRIPIYLRILCSLFFFGQGSYQVGIGHGYLIAQSQPSISRCIAEVSNTITEHLLNVWIKFPATEAERNNIKEVFQQQGAVFEDVIGIIDCTQIKIISPPEGHPIHPGGPYYCRKGYYSINTQIIGDGNIKILNINARFPGSVHDSAIWLMSGINRQLQQEHVRNDRDELNYLIGDSGYPLEPWLMTPFIRVAQDSPESRYNRSLSTLRTIIEHINGLIKGRFRCLHGHMALNYNPIRAAKIIYSCAVLHNICRSYNVPMPVDDEQLPQPHVPADPPRHPGDNDWHNEGSRIRRRLVQQYFR